LRIGRLILVRNNANIKKPVMPRISVVFYQEDAQTVPVLDWLDRLSAKAQDKCRVRIERLRDLGHELRRPEADYLRDGIYEFRGGLQRAVEKDPSASLHSIDSLQRTA
jgi:hypothetical protein